jgi:hypothetical protein
MIVFKENLIDNRSRKGSSFRWDCWLFVKFRARPFKPCLACAAFRMASMALGASVKLPKQE